MEYVSCREELIHKLGLKESYDDPLKLANDVAKGRDKLMADRPMEFRLLFARLARRVYQGEQPQKVYAGPVNAPAD